MIHITQTTIKDEMQRSRCCRCHCVCCRCAFVPPRAKCTLNQKQFRERGTKQRKRGTNKNNTQSICYCLPHWHVLMLLLLLMLLLPLLLQPLLPPLLAAAAASAGCCCKLLGFRLTPNHSSLNQKKKYIYIYKYVSWLPFK